MSAMPSPADLAQRRATACAPLAPSASALLLAGALLLAACGKAAEKQPAPPPRAHLVELAGVDNGRLAWAAERGGSLRALRETRIVNEETGRIAELKLREGDRVAAGQMLLRYDDALLRAAHDKAAAAATLARSEQRRAAALVEQGFVSAEAEARAQANLGIAEAELRLLATRLGYLTLRAPFAGVIATRLVEPNDVTPVHTHLLTLIDPAQLITDVAVSELVLPLLKVGDRAEVRIDALGTTAHRGHVVRIHPGIDAATRMGRVEVALDPLPAGARPGQFCRVTLATGAPSARIVPLAAVQRDTTGEFVYVYRAAAAAADGATPPGTDGATPSGAGSPPANRSAAGKVAESGKVERRAVVTGLRLADRVEIRDGLAAGERVVVKGFLGLVAGKAVKPVPPPAAVAESPAAVSGQPAAAPSGRN